MKLSLPAAGNLPLKPAELADLAAKTRQARELMHHQAASLGPPANRLKRVASSKERV